MKELMKKWFNNNKLYLMVVWSLKFVWNWKFIQLLNAVKSDCKILLVPRRLITEEMIVVAVVADILWQYLYFTVLITDVMQTYMSYNLGYVE